jgi:hypothetical protein
MSFIRLINKYSNQLSAGGYMFLFTLGSYRGYRYYDYKVNKSYENKQKENEERKQLGLIVWNEVKPDKFYYTYAFLYMFSIGCAYCVPPFIPFFMFTPLKI